MNKIYVDESKCIGCGACVGNDPEHFDFGDNGKSVVISQENLESDALHMAIDCCPTSAISMVEANVDNTKDHNEDASECDCSECSCEHCNHEA